MANVDINEQIAVGVFHSMVNTCSAQLQSMFVHSPPPDLEFPKLRLDTKGKRPLFTKPLTPAEQVARFEDPATYQEQIQRFLVQVAKTGDDTEFKAYIEKMGKAKGVGA